MPLAVGTEVDASASRAATVERARRHGRAARSCASSGVADRDAAAALRGETLLVPARERARGGRVATTRTSSAAGRGPRHGRARCCTGPSCDVLEVGDDAAARAARLATRSARRPRGARDRGRPALPRPRRRRSRAVKIDVFTLFPDWFGWFAEQRHVRNALEGGLELDFVDLRATTPLVAGQVDDTPYGGGAGMVIRVDVVEAALEARYGGDPLERAARAARGRARRRRAAVRRRARRPSSPPSPSSRCCAAATRASTSACTSTSPPTWSRSGRYVLAGGELAAMVVCDAVIRKLPGALGHEDSAVEESFSDGARGRAGVPALHPPGRVARPRRAATILLSGDHARIREWRLERRARERLATTRRADATADPGAGRAGRLRYHCAPARRGRCRPPRPFLAMSGVIDSLERAQLRKVPAFQAGDRVKVHFQVVEGTRRRTQVFEGTSSSARAPARARPSPSASSRSASASSARSPSTRRRSSGSRWRAAATSAARSSTTCAAASAGARASASASTPGGGPGAADGGARRAGSQEEAEVLEDAPARRPRRRRRSPPPSEDAADEAEAPADAAEAEAGDGRRREPPPRPRTAADAEADAGAPSEAAAERVRGHRRPDARRMAAEPWPSATRASKAEESGKGSFIELVVIVAVALGLALGIQAFLVKPFRIPSESMVPTLDGRPARAREPRLLPLREPERGDVVVFKPPAGADERPRAACRAEPADGQPCPTPTTAKSDKNFIKRVVGAAGRPPAVTRRAGLHQRQAQTSRSSSPSARLRRLCNLPREITIPPGHFFMMGDNRGESDDSRDWGPVPEEWIIGDAFFTYWPPEAGSARSRKRSRPDAAAGCSPSTARSAGASSPAPTRPAAAASPARSWPPPCCSTSSASRCRTAARSRA